MLARCEARDERWYVPELLRIKGELMLAQRPRTPSPMPKHCSCRRSRRHAGRVRFPGNCAPHRAWPASGGTARHADAGALLRPIYARFTEGFATADLRAAKALLEELPRAIE